MDGWVVPMRTCVSVGRPHLAELETSMSLEQCPGCETERSRLSIHLRQHSFLLGVLGARRDRREG